MRIVLFGASGQLGTALSNLLVDDVIPVPHARADLAERSRVIAALDELAPDLVINAAAWNFVDRAEDEPEQAYAVNALGPRTLAQWCAGRDVPLVHFSTDYVFGRDRARITPYVETDAPGPLGAYAVSKLAGEAFVRAICTRHFVVRTCGLYGRSGSAGKGNFVETMLRLGHERGEVSVVDDQWCTPTWASDLAWGVARLIQTNDYGLYHATNSGATTWRRMAVEIFRRAGLDVTVRPITTAEYPTKARRPAFSVLDCSRLASKIGGLLPPWEAGLAEYLEQRGAHAAGG
jgi:dTDP-4-dehydrorhamnose reductase